MRLRKNIFSAPAGLGVNVALAGPFARWRQERSQIIRVLCDFDPCSHFGNMLDWLREGDRKADSKRILEDSSRRRATAEDLVPGSHQGRVGKPPRRDKAL